MRVRIFLFALAALLGLTVAPGSFAAPEVGAGLDTEKVVIGQPFTYSLTITGERGLQIQLPQIEEILGNFSVVDFNRREREKKGALQVTLDYTLKGFDTGEQVIPQVSLAYRSGEDAPWLETAAAAQSVTVESALEPDESVRKLREIRGPLYLRRWGRWLIAALLIALAAAAVYWRRRIRGLARQGEPLPEEITPAHEIALSELEALRRKDYPRQGLIKQYFTEISGIVRRYLENRFFLHAPEMTTEEFLIQVRERSALAPEHKQLLKAFLEQSDLVKFAKYTASVPECESVFEVAANFVQQTRQDGETC